MGKAMLNKSLIQFSVDGWGCVWPLVWPDGDGDGEVAQSCPTLCTIVWPQINNREGTQPHPSTENWI